MEWILESFKICWISRSECVSSNAIIRKCFNCYAISGHLCVFIDLVVAQSLCHLTYIAHSCWIDWNFGWYHRPFSSEIELAVSMSIFPLLDTWSCDFVHMIYSVAENEYSLIINALLVSRIILLDYLIFGPENGQKSETSDFLSVYHRA